jgi:tetratricopeptide (TPR) repeat protein
VTDTDRPGPAGAPGGQRSEPVGGTAARRARQQAQQAEQGRAAGSNGVAGSVRTAPRPDTMPPSSRRQLDPDALAALEEERDFLLRSLRDLEREHDVGDVDDHDYEVLKDDYTARAAAVLRSVESRRSALVSRRSAPDRRRRTLVAALVVGFAVVLGIGVAQASGRRGSGDEITGDVRQTARDKVLDARAAMGDGRYRDAIGLFDEVIALAPSNVEAHSDKGWLLVLTARQSALGGDRDLLLNRAQAELDMAVELDPHAADARIFRASLFSDIGLPQPGISDLDALSRDDVPPELQARVDALRTRLQQQTPGVPAH